MSDSQPPAAPAPAGEDPATTSADKDEESISFTVKSIADKRIPITVNKFTSVGELKQKLAEPSTIPAERQRLIYSGRVLKDDQTVDFYKIKDGHTVHLVQGAQSNASAARGTVGGGSTSAAGAGASAAGGNSGSGGSAPAPTPQLPSMAAGTGTNPLSRLTNHIPLPSASMFGPDGGMGPPPDPEQMLRMMEQPEVQAGMNALLQNPQMLDHLIQSNPLLQQMGPEARQMMQTEEFRRMMTDPGMFRRMTEMQRAMGMGPFGGRGGLGGMGGGGASAFPAPGVTDQTPADQRPPGATDTPGATGTGTAGSPPPVNPFAALFNPFGAPPQAPAGGAGAPPNMPNPFLFMNPNMFGAPPGGAAAGAQPQTQQPGGTATDPAGTAGTPGTNPQSPPPNPFMNPFFNPGGADMNQLQNLLQMLNTDAAGGAGGPSNPFAAFGGFGGAGAGAGGSPAPQDTRPPEERYADQLRQLNDMGFFDFDRNVTALRRSGGSVQGAVEYLLSSL